MSVRNNPRIVASVDTKRRVRGNVIGFREFLCSSCGDPGIFSLGASWSALPEQRCFHPTREVSSQREGTTCGHNTHYRCATTGDRCLAVHGGTRGNRGSYSAVRRRGPEGCSLEASYSPLPTGGSSEPTDGSVLFTRNAVCFSSESPRPGSAVAAVTRGRRRAADANG